MTAPPVDSANDDMTISTAPSAGGCTVTVRGDVDAGSAPGLRAHLLEVLGRPGVATVHLDLTGVTFLDSAGLTTLVVAHQAAERGTQVLALRCGTSRAVLRPLAITGLSGVLTIVDA
jgi:anti-sigma B factor antagonist